MANDPVYTNVTDLITDARAISKSYSAVAARARAWHDEFLRVGGENRVSPFFFTLDTPAVLRQDLPFSLAELLAAASAFEVLSGKTEPGDVPGMAAKIAALLASLDKVKS